MRALAARMSYAELIAWGVFLRIRAQPAKAWIRDPDQIEAVAAAYYGN